MIENVAGYQLERDGGQVTVTLNRPKLHNAFDEHLIAALRDLFIELRSDAAVRVMILRATGKNFSAGADLNWMKRAAKQDRDANIKDAHNLEQMLYQLDHLPFPVIARIQGAAIGGGLGLVAGADLAVATPNSVFAASEVRLGIVPAVISPFVINAIGVRQARRYFLTAERFSADRAQAMGLIHEVAGDGELDQVVEDWVADLLKGGPLAIADAKRLTKEVPQFGYPERAQYCATMIADRRASEEGAEGIQAFLDKRRPSWTG